MPGLDVEDFDDSEGVSRDDQAIQPPNPQPIVKKQPTFLGYLKSFFYPDDGRKRYPISPLAYLHLKRFFDDPEIIPLQATSNETLDKGHGISDGIVFYTFYDRKFNYFLHAFYPTGDADKVDLGLISLKTALETYIAANWGTKNITHKLIIPLATHGNYSVVTSRIPTFVRKEHWLELYIEINPESPEKSRASLIDPQADGLLIKYDIQYIQNTLKTIFDISLDQPEFLGHQQDNVSCGPFFLTNSQFSYGRSERVTAISDELYSQYEKQVDKIGEQCKERKYPLILATAQPGDQPIQVQLFNDDKIESENNNNNHTGLEKASELEIRTAIHNQGTLAIILHMISAYLSSYNLSPNTDNHEITINTDDSANPQGNVLCNIVHSDTNFQWNDAFNICFRVLLNQEKNETISVRLVDVTFQAENQILKFLLHKIALQSNLQIIDSEKLIKIIAPQISRIEESGRESDQEQVEISNNNSLANSSNNNNYNDSREASQILVISADVDQNTNDNSVENQTKKSNQEKIAELQSIINKKIDRLKKYRDAYIHHNKKTRSSSCFSFFSYNGHGKEGVRRANEHCHLFVSDLTQSIGKYLEDVSQNCENLSDDEMNEIVIKVFTSLILTAKRNLIEVRQKGSNLNRHSYTMYLMSYIEELEDNLSNYRRTKQLDSLSEEIQKNPDQLQKFDEKYRRFKSEYDKFNGSIKKMSIPTP